MRVLRSAIPGEVPALDSASTMAIRVFESDYWTNQDLNFSWDPALNAVRYNIWRGTIRSLFESRQYNHTIPGSAYCNLLPSMPFTLLIGQAEAPEGDATSPPLTGAYYYLISGEAECPVGVSFDGPLGFADSDADPATVNEARPGGILPLPLAVCTP